MKLDTEALKRQMTRKFLNGKRLSEQIGISTTATYKILKGINQPSPDTLRKLCEVLEVDPDDLIEEW